MPLAKLTELFPRDTFEHPGDGDIIQIVMSNETKEEAVQQVYDYLSSNEYANKVNDVVTQLLDLGRELKNEVTSHKRIWENRYHIYKVESGSTFSQ